MSEESPCRQDSSKEKEKSPRRPSKAGSRRPSKSGASRQASKALPDDDGYGDATYRTGSTGSRLKEVFARFDKSGDGNLDIRAMRTVLTTLSPGLDANEVAAMCTELDSSKDGEVSFKEFAEWIKQGGGNAKMISKAIKASSDRRTVRIKETFDRYDKSGDGSLDIQELRHVLTGLGPFSAEEVKSVCADLDKSQDGEISHKEFHDWIVGKAASPTISKAKAFLAPSDDDGLEGAFYNFCGAGHVEMDGRSLLKTFKDCDLMGKKLTSQAVDLIFSKTKSKLKTGIEFQQFELIIDSVAEIKGEDIEDVRLRIVSNRPVFKGHKAADVDPVTGAFRSSVSTKRPKGHVFLPKTKKPVVGPDRTVDNSDLYKLFGVGTPAGRMLKRIYYDNSVSALSTMRSGTPISIMKSTSLPSIPGASATAKAGWPFPTLGPDVYPDVRSLTPQGQAQNMLRTVA